MSGTKEGSRKAVAKILENNPDHFKQIGLKGGKKKNARKGFGSLSRAEVMEIGRKGGQKSKRGKAEKSDETNQSKEG